MSLVQGLFDSRTHETASSLSLDLPVGPPSPWLAALKRYCQLCSCSIVSSPPARTPCVVSAAAQGPPLPALLSSRGTPASIQTISIVQASCESDRAQRTFTCRAPDALQPCNDEAGPAQIAARLLPLHAHDLNSPSTRLPASPRPPLDLDTCHGHERCSLSSSRQRRAARLDHPHPQPLCRDSYYHKRYCVSRAAPS